MILNLFSVFDPSTGLFSLNWFRIIAFLLLPTPFWKTPSKLTSIIINVYIKIIKEIIIHIKTRKPTILIVRMFSYLLIINILGLIPYVFTTSAHLSVSLAIALTIWTSLMIYGWLNSTNKIFIHLVPLGTPKPLIPFIVIIESIRNVIRPGSLAVRLTANIIAGHLLISLLGNNLISNFPLMIIIIWLFIGLLVFELAVAFIQSYVFITLSTLYSREI